ncbi:LysM peptidoglycan-binding domain-containing protein [Streptomyces griseomycini]|uniref:Nucleoid-associated protein YgaU n=1 Tax=Streptomyces griseomycini TaxID=66895 RepID=A0A7W7VAS6_9ACTN|nr:LysM peptidoglycan-binding domain-containing protein [Streptomyces griseomycini]MBB4903285.1 nucleoid-associated protein YgaU [Streptomyces griseomycini]GGR43767.1 membrane protein [Streptomyces griseomycini]
MPTPTTHASLSAGRTLGRVLKALGSLLVLLGMVGGLPLLLAWATPVVWESSRDDLAHLLDRQDTGAAFLMLLIVIGWISWAQFAFCAVREGVAQLRGRTWHAPRGLGASQRAAATLIGGILILLPANSALASPAQAADPSMSAAQVPGPAQADQSAEQVQEAADSQPGPSRTVRPGESLWSIAERELGDGERWREIAALNEGRTMPGGQVFKSSSFLQPGWQLQMPETAATAGGFHVQLAGQASAASDESERVVSVHEGDYLSKIAQEELGDAGQWQELFDASKGKPQPDGLPAITDPDVIYAGQQITVPKAQTPDEERHTPPADSRDSAPSDEADGRPSAPADTPAPEDEQQPDDRAEGEVQPSAPGQSATPAPEASAAAPSQQPSRDAGAPGVTPEQDSSASPSATPSESAGSSGSAESSPAPAASESPAPAPAGSFLNLRTVLGAGALLAAAITGALALRRTLQRRRRKPGEKIAIAPETSTAEAKLAAAAEPDGAARLDLALRTLAHQVARREDDATLPQLRAARIGARTLQVLPEDLMQDPPAPFVAGQGGWWTLPADADLLGEQDAREVPAPYPALVTIGSTEGGDLVLLNLAQLPALLLDGNPLHLTEVCTSLALELGMSPWAAEAEVVVIGFGEDLPQLLPTTRIAHMRQPQHALRDLSERLLEAHQMPETRHQPYVLLCAAALDADTAWEFAEVIDKAGTVPVALVAPASTAAVHFPTAEILNTSLTRPQHVDVLGAEITVQRLEHAAYQQITTALKVSGQPAHPAEGAWREVPDEPEAQRPESPAPKEPAATAEEPAAMSEPVPAASPQEAKVREEVFPALLAASTDPAGLRLLPTTDRPFPDESSSNQDDHSGQDPDAAATAAAVAVPDDEHSGTESKAPDAGTSAAHDLHAPEIQILGPVEVTGVDSSGHGPRMAQLATLLYFRPGRHADVLCEAMDPISPWSTSTLNARLQGLRRCLGNDPDGQPYVPRRSTGEDPYRLSPGVRCDWSRFLYLVERALPLGPAGLPDLEKALTLVRGKPFGGKPLPWAEPFAQEMTTRIIDIAHTVAVYRTPAGPHQDLNAARQAVATGLEVDDTAELIYRDWLRLEAAAGNRSGLHTAISRIQQINRALDCSPEPETEQLINDLLNSPNTAERNAL